MKQLLRLLAFLLVSAFLSACAAHNAHRVRVDPQQIAPLVDEALNNLEASLGEPIPSERVAVSVSEEPVVVRWVLPPNALDPNAAQVERADLQPFLLEALQRTVPTSAPELADYVVELHLEVDLHDPGALGLRVCSDLVETPKGRRVAEGLSACMRLPRLYCHGCRDAWGGHGSSLDLPGTGSYDGGDYGVYVPICNPPSSGGYTKH